MQLLLRETVYCSRGCKICIVIPQLYHQRTLDFPECIWGCWSVSVVFSDLLRGGTAPGQ